MTHHEDFLYRVAQDIYDKAQGDLSRTIVVFPNKRASLFFKEYLAELADGPVWLPECIAINDLPHRFTSMQKVDKVKAICLLYKVYVTCLTAHGDSLDPADSFDRFYGWGERLLADFNEIDRQLHREIATKVFENASDYEVLNDSPIADNEEAYRAITRFIAHWKHDVSQHERERFMRLWHHLPQIHNNFIELLSEQPEGPEGYEGLIWRDALLRIETKLATDSHSYAFVGLNALSNVEQEVLLKIKDIKRENCLFYWDYDERYTLNTTHEAGLYMRRNLSKAGFQNSLENSMQRPLPAVDFVSSSTDSAQVRYATTWLRTIKMQHPNLDERRIAIVLCDENLLQPLLHVIPNEVKAVNITKGFPLKQTIAYRDLLTAIKRQIKTKHTDIVTFIRNINTEITKQTQASHVAKLQQHGIMRASDALRALNTEAYFKIHVTLNQFETLAQEAIFSPNIIGEQTSELFAMIGRLISQAVSLISIPFHGEPICGIQIMGLLETRTLDFDHILFLGANDGKLPLAETNKSFIPYPIRRFFGLPTAEERIAVSAYYFNRLLHRAHRVTILYNNSTSGSGKGEMSRFMWEMLVDYTQAQLPIIHYTIDDRPKTIYTNVSSITKTVELLRPLTAKYTTPDGKTNTHTFSPSALATYINCPLQFYYRYIAKLTKPNEDKALLPANVMGSIFHAASELLYKPMLNEPISYHKLTSYAKNEGNVLYNAVQQVLLNPEIQQEAPQASQDKIAIDAIVYWLKQLFKYDAQQAKYHNFIVRDVELNISTEITAALSNENIVCRVGGIIDRLDEVKVNDKHYIRIFDYKTGGTPKSFNNVVELFRPTKEHNRYVFQIFLYAYILTQEKMTRQLPLLPALYFLKKATTPDYTPYVKDGKESIVDDFETNYAKAVGQELEKLINEIFDLTIPFAPTNNAMHCVNCDFRKLCNR